MKKINLLIIIILALFLNTNVYANTSIPTTGSFDCTYVIKYNDMKNAQRQVTIQLTGNGTNSSTVNYKWGYVDGKEICDFSSDTYDDCAKKDLTYAFEITGQDMGFYASIDYAAINVNDFVSSEGKWQCPTIKYESKYDSDSYGQFGFYVKIGNSSSSYASSSTATKNNCIQPTNNQSNEIKNCSYMVNDKKATAEINLNTQKMKLLYDGITSDEYDYSSKNCPNASDLKYCWTNAKGQESYITYKRDCIPGYSQFSFTDVQVNGDNDKDKDNNKDKIDWGDEVNKNCEGILGDELLEFINKIFGWIQIAAPIIVIVLGGVEFAGAILQDDKDALKKASNKFIKRLIIAVALFFIPMILELLLKVFNEVSGSFSSTCGIGE